MYNDFIMVLCKWSMVKSLTACFYIAHPLNTNTSFYNYNQINCIVYDVYVQGPHLEHPKNILTRYTVKNGISNLYIILLKSALKM